MKTIVVEKDGYVQTSGSAFSFTGSSYSTLVPSKSWEFRADHWHENKEQEYSGTKLDIIDSSGEVIATFKDGYWNRVYFKGSMA